MMVEAWTVAQLVQVAVVAVLISSGSAKVFSPSQFAGALAVVANIPSRYSPAAARGVGIGELLIAGAVVFTHNSILGALALGVLGLAIVSFSALALIRQIKVACGCFGEFEAHPLGWRNVSYGLGFVAAASFLFAAAQFSFTVVGDTEVAVVVVGAALLALGCALAIRRRELSKLFSRGLGRGQ